MITSGQGGMEIGIGEGGLEQIGISRVGELGGVPPQTEISLLELSLSDFAFVILKDQLMTGRHIV